MAFNDDLVKGLAIGALAGGAAVYLALNTAKKSATGGSSDGHAPAPGELGLGNVLPDTSPMWFSEGGHIPGQKGEGGEVGSMAIEEVLVDVHSPYQHIQFFRTKTYGNMLVLDGNCQVTEYDEFSYQEMMTHLALCSHPNPKRVLVVGGGDGGVVREALKHSSVEEVVLCEIDQMVMDLSRVHLPGLSAGAFDHPKTTVFCGDGMEYMRKHEDYFDVIIADSSDPIGPASALFEEAYCVLMKKALKSNGLLCTQAESMWFAADVIAEMLDFSRGLFAKVEYAYTTIPTYPSGTIGFLLCSKDDGTNFSTPLRSVADSMGSSGATLKYYSTAIHAASFVLPEFGNKLFGSYC